jgi:UDP-GlcNAc:undecaprenyl-phosphate/decaprenyl-phosphate GlcNAc-1-phosphate transferase
MNNFLLFLLIFFISVPLSVILTILCMKVATHNKIMDIPNPRKIHKAPVPYLGGVAIFISFFATLLISTAVFPECKPYFTNMGGLLISSCIIFFLGLYDNLRDANAMLKFSFQIIAAIIVVYSGFSINILTNPFGADLLLPSWLSIDLTVLWIVAIINAINLLDGLDGLAGGVVCISSLFLFIVALLSQNNLVAILSFLLFSSTFGFLFFNFPPAKIFMGDTGSMFLGFIFSVIAIIGNRKSAVAINLLVPIVLLSIPIVDTLMAILRRAKKKKNLFQADREHLHHRLLNLKLPYDKILVLIYLLCLYLGLISILSVFLEKKLILLLLFIIGSNMGLFLLFMASIEKHLETASKKVKRK